MSETESSELRGAARIAIVAALTVIAAFVASKAARDAVILSTFSVERFPLFVGISAALSLPVVIVAGRLLARFGPQRLLPTLNVLSAVMLVGEWFLLDEQPRVAAVIVFLHLGSLGAVLVSGFWSIVNERFDVQSAKRYAGRIGAGATIGGIVGGVVAERTAVLLEPGAILLVLAGLQSVSAVVLVTLARGQTPRATSDEEVARLSALRTIGRLPLLRNLGIVVVLGAVSAAALDFVFKAEVIVATDGQPLRVLALYHTATSVLTALVQIALARVALAHLGAARTVVTLPIAVTGFGILSAAVPGLYSAMGARGAEAITRSSLYRAGYELLFAPLPERDKRETKVVLDVGAERVGDLLGSQLVSLLLVVTVDPRAAVTGMAIIVGVLTLLVASRVPGNYTRALEHSLVERVRHDDAIVEVEPSESLMWSAFGGATMSEHGADRAMLSLFDLRTSKVREVIPGEPKRRPSAPAVTPPPSLGDPVLDTVAAIRQRDVSRVRQLLAAGITPELVPYVVPLLAWNEVAREAHAALSKVAPRCTGALVDMLLDPDQEFTIRRRLPAVIAHGDPAFAAWGLVRGLADARFEVRYRCGRALGEIRARGQGLPVGEPEVHALVERELAVETEVMHNYRLLDGDDDKPELSMKLPVAANRAPPTALAHVFNLLALALPAEPIRIAFHGLHTQDRDLRATALEYLESALPHALSSRLWPLIELEAPKKAARSREEIAAALTLSSPKIEAHLAALRESRT